MARTVFFRRITNTNEITAGTAGAPTDSQLSEDQDMGKHGFFNHLTVINNSGLTVQSRLYGSNQDEKGVEDVPPGGTLIYDEQDSIRYRRPYIFNPDSSTNIAADEIVWIIRKVE